MHYYKRNIGDYAKKAGRLSILQHGVYNLLIDACYDRERFPTTEEAIDWVWASTQEEEDAVRFVLKKFFQQDENGCWVQGRIQEEVAEYQHFLEKQVQNGKKGGRPKKQKKESQTDEIETEENPLGYSENPLESQKKPKPLTNKPLTNKTHTDTSQVTNNHSEINPVTSVCIAITNFCRQNGLDPTKISPSHPKLIALVEAGADETEFIDGLRRAVDKGISNYFTYAIGCVQGAREEAAKMKLHNGKLHKSDRDRDKQVMGNSIFGHLETGKAKVIEHGTIIEAVAENVD